MGEHLTWRLCSAEKRRSGPSKHMQILLQNKLSGPQCGGICSAPRDVLACSTSMRAALLDAPLRTAGGGIS